MRAFHLAGWACVFFGVGTVWGCLKKRCSTGEPFLSIGFPEPKPLARSKLGALRSACFPKGSLKTLLSLPLLYPIAEIKAGSTSMATVREAIGMWNT